MRRLTSQPCSTLKPPFFFLSFCRYLFYHLCPPYCFLFVCSRRSCSLVIVHPFINHRTLNRIKTWFRFPLEVRPVSCEIKSGIQCEWYVMQILYINDLVEKFFSNRIFRNEPLEVIFLFVIFLSKIPPRIFLSFCFVIFNYDSCKWHTCRASNLYYRHNVQMLF